ncbi:MAG: cell wall anchor protein, partial [Muribaculaceae bacterium]|nr:cell wall anchor protein [Muribaculaceae bacterium]
MKSINYLIAVTVAMLTTLGAVAGNTIIKAKMDSTTLLMGKVTAIHVEIVQDKGVQGFLLADRLDTLQTMVEVAARPKPDTTDIDNGRMQIKRDIIVQSFDSGMYVIPPLQYVVGRDTFASKPLHLKVMPVKVDSLATIHDLKPVATVPFKLGDWLPDFIADYWWAW